MPTSAPETRRGQILTVAAAFVVLWWALAGAGAASWLLGAPLVAVATALAAPGNAIVWRISPFAFLRFLPCYLWLAFTGGVDVARRALDPRLPLAPALLHFRLRLAGEPAVVLSNVLNLSPGTLTVELDGDQLLLHVVDGTRPVEAQVRAAEEAVAKLVGIAIPAVRG